MDIDRRGFLKIAGLTTVTGMAGNCIKGTQAEQILSEELLLPSKRWAMLIDLKKCHEVKDCRDCIDACHLAHNVPDFNNPKDGINWIWKDSFEHAFHELKHEFITEELKHIPALLLCNHCDNPACVKVCPTNATWKREDGVVMMDWHRCIGCRYCMAACPYGSRSFNWREPKPFIKKINKNFPARMRGVVEKCTFCNERLVSGKMPLCVEACKVRAIVFGDLEDPDSEIRKLLQSHFSVRRKPGLGTNPEVYYLI